MRDSEEMLTKSMSARFIFEDILEISPPANWKGQEKLEHAQENTDALYAFVGDKTVGVLAILPKHPLSKEAREHYQHQIPPIHCAALVAPSFIQKVVGNLLLNFGKPFDFPAKLFTSKRKALNWIGEQMNEYYRSEPTENSSKDNNL